MRFLVMHKVDANMEAGGPPSQEIIQGMGALVGESIKAGLFLDGAGLHRSAERVRLSSAAGRSTLTRGPLQGQNELVARMAMLKTRTMDDAIEYAQRYAGVLGDGEIEIGPVVEAWDIGIMPKPSVVDAGRFLLLCKGDAKTEAGTPLSPEQGAAISRLTEELSGAGVLLKSEVLEPSAKAVRLASGTKEKRSWIDGPFAESKELVAGFSILKVPSLSDAIAWANRYAAILGDNEVDVWLLKD